MASPLPPQSGFNINNAMNTFNQQLGARVASGQMTMDQARAAQAEMTALQRMPNATREQATDVAQRQMQVGQYAPTPVTPPMPQGGLTLSNVPQRLTLSNTPPPMEDIVVQPIRSMPAPLPLTPPAPMPKMVQQPTPTEVIGSRMPPPGVRSGDTRIFADQPMALPGGSGYDERGNILRAPQPRSLTDILQRGLMMPSQPVARPQPMPQPVARPMPQPMAQRPTGMLFNNLMNKYRGRAY